MALFGNSIGTETAAVRLLEEDHNKVKDLFEQFKDAKDSRRKLRIAGQTLEALTAHAAIEEEIFYPAVRAAHEDEEEAGEILDAALQEHHVAKILISELEKMSPSDKFFDAKFRVLAESVGHHIDEEESEIFPKVSEDGTNWEEIGNRMKERKAQLVGRGSARQSGRRGGAGRGQGGRRSAADRHRGGNARRTKSAGARGRNRSKAGRGSSSKASAKKR
jgi:hemerythrin superfamily protein